MSNTGVEDPCCHDITSIFVGLLRKTAKTNIKSETSGFHWETKTSPPLVKVQKQYLCCDVDHSGGRGDCNCAECIYIIGPTCLFLCFHLNLYFDSHLQQQKVFLHKERPLCSYAGWYGCRTIFIGPIKLWLNKCNLSTSPKVKAQQYISVPSLYCWCVIALLVA